MTHPTTQPALARGSLAVVRRARRARRTGATVMEMALTLMVLLALSFGTVEFGHFFFLKNTVQGAAREGVRAAMTPGGSNMDVTAAVTSTLQAAGLTLSDFTTTVKVNGVVANADSAAAGQTIEVTVEATWGTVGLRPMGLIDSAKALRGVAVMRKEGA